MGFYHRYLYLIYHFYTKVLNENSIPLFYITSVSTTLLFINFYTIYLFLVYSSIFIDFINSKVIILLIMVTIGGFNYLAFVRHRKFMLYDSSKTIRASLSTVLYITLTVLAFIAIATKNREKIRKAHIRNHSFYIPSTSLTPLTFTHN